MGSVRLRGKRYYGTWVDERGRTVEKALRARTVTEARRLVAEAEALASRVRLGLEEGASDLTIAGAWEKYQPVAQQRRSWRTLEGRFRNHILPALGTQLLHRVRPADIEAFLASKRESGLSPQTCEHLRVHLSALFTFARVKLRVKLPENPARLAERPEIQDRPPRYLETAQVAAILEVVDSRWQPFFAAAVYTGMRKGELCGLRRVDVDLGRRIITVGHSYDGPTKAGKVRWVPIPHPLMAFLAAQLRRVGDSSEFVFPGQGGAGLTPDFDANAMLQTALKRAGLVRGYRLICRRTSCRFTEESKQGEARPCPKCGFRLWVQAQPLKISFKDLRSTHATHAYEATGDIRYVQRVLGHSDPRVTERIYAGMRAEQLLAQADRVSFAGPADALPISTAETSRNQPNGDEEP